MFLIIARTSIGEFGSMRTGPHWLIGVPNRELVDLRVSDGIRLFFPFILQWLKFVKNRRKVHMSRLFVCFAKCGGNC